MHHGNRQGTMLFSIDLEDVRLMVPGGERFRDAVPEMTRRYLEFLEAHGGRATFFVVGRVALRHPELVAEIQARGHEIACHSHDHIPLDQLGPEQFRRDLNDNIEALVRAGAEAPRGYRAPTFSLTQATRWAYAILRDAGIQYSSSVLPARNPLYGWPDFGTGARVVSDVVELPVTLSDGPLLRVPLAGGIYFRVLPFALTRHWLRRKLREGTPIVNYLHPYDVDDAQEEFMHPGINGSRFYNWLMYRNRDLVLERMHRVLELGYSIVPCRDYVATLSFDSPVDLDHAQGGLA